jgi:DNA modification methylase
VGSGTAAMAAKMTQRHYVGYDISAEYVAEAHARLAALDQPHVIEERIAKKQAGKNDNK